MPRGYGYERTLAGRLSMSNGHARIPITLEELKLPVAERRRLRHAKDPEARNAPQRARNRKLRLDALAAYGSVCACCGETTEQFLGIDHINGGGNAHRKENGLLGNNLNRWLKKNDYPPEFQVLCHNCNLAKGFYGKCPHAQG